MSLKAKWVDGKREPKCAPDPAFPSGKDMHAAFGSKTCRVELPYPARRCGWYVVSCDKCGQSMILTTAGRADDPKSITIDCIEKPH